MQHAPSFRARSRAHSLLLSAQGTTIKDIAKTSQAHRVTVSAWITHWEHDGAQSLHDTPRSGRPPILTPAEQDSALQYLQEDPCARKRLTERVAATTAKRLRVSSRKRLATKARLRWKRGRKSLKSFRDPDVFATAKRALEALQRQEDQGKSALYYYDESGFALDPTLP